MSHPPDQGSTPGTGRNRRWLGFGLAAGGLALLLVAVAAMVAFAFTPDEFQPGDCLSLDSERGGAMSSATCGSPDSDYQVTAVHPGRDRDACGDDFANIHDNATYCVLLDVKIGDCLTSFQDNEAVLPLKVACTGRQDRVARIGPSQDPDDLCRDGEGFYVFSRETICLTGTQGA